MLSTNAFAKLFFGTAGIQFFSRGISVVAGVIFARFLGAEQYGLYTYVLSIVNIAALPVLAGLPNLMVREIASFHYEKNWSNLQGMLLWSRFYVFGLSLIIFSIMIGLVHFGYFEPHVATLIYVAVWVIPLRGIATQQDSVLNGFGKPILAQLPSKLLAPVITLSILLYFVVTGTPLSSMTLVFISVLALVFTCVLSFFLVRYVVRKNAQTAKPTFSSKPWFKSLLPFAMITFVFTLNTELAIVLLGWMTNLESIAYFRVATQAVMLITILRSSIDAVIMPKIARFYRSEAFDEIQILLTRSVRLTMFTSSIIFVILIFGGQTLINVLFGHEYEAAYLPLIILCVGQFISIFLGSSAAVLNMTNNEQKTMKTLMLSLVINVGLMLLLVPLYQEVGAAIAVSISLVLSHLLMSREVFKITRLHTSLCFAKSVKEAKKPSFELK
ncbi:flippase [Vibrio marinisediminis]|uniref:flippase n=1 Tax=Vibrio marinisediminis TaxID=2758441 RepID=UPI0034D2A881